MKNIKLKMNLIIAFVPLLILCVFRLQLPQAYEISGELSPMFKSFPLTIDQWRGTETVVDEKVYEILETRNVLSRVYNNNQNESIDLLLVASHKDRRVAHPPEVCYISSNYEILEKSKYEIESDGVVVSVNQFVARNERNPKDRQEVLYLYKVGERFTANYYSQQIKFAIDQLSGNRQSEVFLIRVAGWDREVLEKFLPEIIKILKK